MRGQMYLISAVLIVIFLATVFTYLNLSQSYDIKYKYQRNYNFNWKVNATNRFVYTVYGKSKILEFNFPYSFSNLTVFSNKPLPWQRDEDKIFVEDTINNQYRIYYFYVNGTTFNFDPIFGDSEYYLLTYKLLPKMVETYGGDNITFSCNSIDSVGPVFVKFCKNYAFKDFLLMEEDFNLTAENVIIDGVSHPCSDLGHFSNAFLIFDGNYYMELVNFTGNVNCTSNVWNLKLEAPVYIYITPQVDPYAYSYFGDYKYNVSLENIDDYFSYMLSHYSEPYKGYYKCKKAGGLINSFGDLTIQEPWVNNSFIQWNTSVFYYDSMNLQNGEIEINDEAPNWIYTDKLVAQTSKCNATFYFFNMSPVIYVKLNGLCKLHLPIGVGTTSYKNGEIIISNDSYKVYYVGDILSNSTFPNIYAYNDFYIIIARENYVEPFFYEFNSFCPRIS